MATKIADAACIALNTDKIRQLREAKNLNQTAMAKSIGMTVGRWNDIESGRRANVTLSTLDSIARALGVKAKDLLK